MSEQKTTGAVPIAFEKAGPEDGVPVLMLNGLGMQLTQWNGLFLDRLHAAGLRTVRIDNRDTGLSGRLEGRKAPNPYLQLLLTTFGLKTSAPYRLEDMADDAAAVLDHLGAEKAHLIGLSMGGIIAQVFAARHPNRTQRMALLMTTTNNRSLPRPKGEAAKILFDRRPPAQSVDEATDRLVAKWQFFMTADGGMGPEELRSFHREAVLRGMDPAGWQRQLGAIIETGDIRRYTQKIKAPALVIHGKEDKLVPIEAGRDVAGNLAGARLEEVEGMGHDIAPRFAEKLGAMVAEHLTGSEKV